MEKVTYADCIQVLVPNAEWSISGNEYNSISWDNAAYTKHNEIEIIKKKKELEGELPLKLLRRRRDILLYESDKYVLSDFPHGSDSKKTEWLTYRQSLRDITNQSPTLSLLGELENVSWPEEPS